MFTIVKVREGITSYDDPGWYQHPTGTVAQLAQQTELTRQRLGGWQHGAEATRTPEARFSAPASHAARDHHKGHDMGEPE